MPSRHAVVQSHTHTPVTAGLRLSRYHVASDVAIVEGQRVRAVMATRTGAVARVDADFWDRLRSDDQTDMPDDVRDELVAMELLVEDEDELAVVLDRSNATRAGTTVLKVVIQPTAACQLDCVYCGQEHTSTRLCPKHQDAVVARAERQLRTDHYKVFDVGWFGAEPLLGLDVIRAMTPRLHRLAEAHGCRYAASVVTNGLRLTPDVAAELEALDVSLVEVTIDGVGQWHDRQRPYKSGRGSFDKIMRNLVDVARTRPAFKLSVRCNVTAESAADVPRFIDMLSALRLQDGIDRVYFAPIHSWGNGASAMSLEKAAFARLEMGWIARLLRLGFTPSSLPGVKPIVCMATLPNAELVDASGNLFNCTEVSYVPAYGDPNRYRIGDIESGVDETRRALLGDFNHRIATGEVPCHTCHLLPVCGGSCPKAWHEGDVPCPTFKWYLPTRLLFELAPAAGHPDPVDATASERRPRPDVDRVLAEFGLAGTRPHLEDDACASRRPDFGPRTTSVQLGQRRHRKRSLTSGLRQTDTEKETA